MFMHFFAQLCCVTARAQISAHARMASEHESALEISLDAVKTRIEMDRIRIIKNVKDIREGTSFESKKNRNR